MDAPVMKYASGLTRYETTLAITSGPASGPSNGIPTSLANNISGHGIEETESDQTDSFRSSAMFPTIQTVRRTIGWPKWSIGATY